MTKKIFQKSVPAQCLVCADPCVRLFYTSPEGRDYWRCEHCLATFLDPSQRPSPDQEVVEYCKHENDLWDPGYRKFLNRLVKPLLECLPPEQCGLDYGCGPGPLLAAMMREAGHQMAVYDPFFYATESVLQRPYDFITCTEVAEHFYAPAQEFHRLYRLLKPGGWLAVMTCFQTDDALFANWHYRRDPTHVVFYRQSTFECLANQYAWECLFPARNVVFFVKPPDELSRSEQP